MNRFLSSLKLTTQILGLQAITIGLVFTIVAVICFLQIYRFQQYIQDELLESVIQKSIISNIQLLVGESMQLTYITYTQYGDELSLLNNLYYFQRNNKILLNGLLEDCQNATQLKSYQQCYNGSSIEENNQIQEYLKFQNQIIPCRQNHQQFIGYFNIILGDQLSYTTQVQEQKPKFDENLEKIYLQVLHNNLTLNINQVQNGIQQQAYILFAIPQTKIAIGVLVQEYQQTFRNLEYEGLQVRTYIVIESGLILTDTKLEFQGQYFQNISGFTNLQFEKIKNFTFGLQVPNQCEKQLQGKTLCFIDNSNNQIFIFSYYYNTEFVKHYIINILDGKFVGEIRKDFNKQFNKFVNLQIKLLCIILFSVLVLCLAIQAILIINLSRPLHQLVKIAQYNFNHNEYKFQTIIRSKNRSQIKQLQDAYFDLINLSKQNNCNHVYKFYKYNPSIQKMGIIDQVHLNREVQILRAYIKKFVK